MPFLYNLGIIRGGILEFRGQILAVPVEDPSKEVSDKNYPKNPDSLRFGLDAIGGQGWVKTGEPAGDIWAIVRFQDQPISGVIYGRGEKGEKLQVTGVVREPDTFFETWKGFVYFVPGEEMREMSEMRNV